MSTRSSLVYIEYPRISGSLHIYFQIADCRYYIQDEQGGIVELPKDFAKILNDKYKYLIPKDPMREEWKKKRRAKGEGESECIHYLPMNGVDIVCGQLLEKGLGYQRYPEYTSDKEKVSCEKCRATKIFRD